MKNIYWNDTKVKRSDRETLFSHRSVCIWITGLSGSGKSTIANELQNKLFEEKAGVYILDGDNIRHGLNSDLGFTDKDRVENIRRVAEVSKLFVDAGMIVICSFISPFRKDRKFARSLYKEDEFVEVFLDCPLEVCEERDTKGLYKKARAGEIKEFTGIDSPFEEPLEPEIKINTKELTVSESVQNIYDYMVSCVKLFDIENAGL